MPQAQNAQTDSRAVTVIALLGILLVNAAAVFLILRATQDPTAFFVACIIVSIAAVIVDVTAIRTALAARRRRVRALKRTQKSAAVPES